ncbi:hypothetical protein DSO57_1020460 [Entomophthora muscae]|uniref:Uncharacterized protein n=1 Tax=Entomophthora muscae TaxID=34485 RepID=A0ACC2U261_9FUNG|nr:hypothetical protein DSO57_1020460 [Entomophthora muscae]
MYITINSNYDFYFPRDYSTTMAHSKMAFVDVLAHEVNHGLGFASTLEKRTKDLVMPFPQFWESVTSTPKNTSIRFYFSAYDQHISSKSQGTSFIDYAKALAKLKAKNVQYKDFKANIKGYPHHEIFKNLSAAVNLDQDLYFTTHSNTNVTLECSLFRRGGTLHHLDSATYHNTQDVIMHPNQKKGEGVHKIYDRTNIWITAPYGRDTLQVLSTLGYTLNPNPVHEDSLEHFYLQFHPEPFLFRAKKFFAHLWNFKKLRSFGQ